MPLQRNADYRIKKDQWVDEVESWFMKAIVEAILDAEVGPISKATKHA
jgi:hypothetical protein